MENQFLPYELALKLKELGFDGECIKGFYEGEPIYTIVSTPVDFNNKKQLGELVSAPLWQQAFDWFRENEGFDVVIKRNGLISYKGELLRLGNYANPIEISSNTYEKVRVECLKKLIEIIEQQNQS